MSKLEKESFVSGLKGSSLVDLAAVILVMPAAYALRVSLPTGFFFDCIALILPLLISVTDISYTKLLLLSATLLTFPIIKLTTSSKKLRIVSEMDRIRMSVSAFRALLQLSTVISILAVDFKFYPRRLAKTETYGVSLMDLGVGSFVFSMGVVSSSKLYNPLKPFIPQFMQSIKRGSAVIIIGVIRVLFTKSVDYQEHVSEYGTHWNFFFTLGLLPPVIVTLLFFTKSASTPYLFMLGGLIIYAYQLSLNYGLEHYILNAPRVDIISQNKEGICSFAGYLAIFLISATFGSLIFNPHGLRNAVLMVTLFTLSCFAVFYSDTAVSRRIANAGYVIFVTTTCMWMIIMFDTVNLLAGRYWHVSFPQVLKSINRNQLFTFLIANVGTGAVNMNMDTLSQSDLNGFIIVAVYVMVVALTAIFLDIRLDSTIKI